MLFTSSFDPSAETNSTTEVNLFQTLCGWIFSLLGVPFNSHVAIRYHCTTWMETAKRFQVSALYHQPWYNQRVPSYPQPLWCSFYECLCVCLFCKRQGITLSADHSSLCVRGRYGLVETCHLPLSFDGSRFLISSAPISRPMRGASPHLITFPLFTRSLCQTPPLRVCHIHKASIHPLFITQHTFRKNI